MSLEIKNASQVCCLAARLGGLLYRFRCVDNKNPDSSPVSVIWERNYRDCIPQQRYTFCFNSLIIYRVSVPGTICTPSPNPPATRCKDACCPRKGRFCGWDVKMSGLRHKCPHSVVQAWYKKENANAWFHAHA